MMKSVSVATVSGIRMKPHPVSGPVGGNRKRWDRFLGDDLPLALCSRKSTGYVEFQLTLDESKEHHGVFHNSNCSGEGFSF